MKCTAKSKRTGKKCRANAVTGRQVCYHHGGKTPAGIASPQYEHGRYSKVIPTQLVEHYRQAQEDPDRLSIDADIGLLDGLLRGALDSMNRGDPGELWEKLHEAAQAYKRALKSKKEGDDPQEHLSMVLWLIEEGYHDYMARIEIRQMLQERARLVDAESRRLERAQGTVTVERALVFADRVMESVKRNVRDERIRSAIVQDIFALTGGEVRRGAAATGD